PRPPATPCSGRRRPPRRTTAPLPRPPGPVAASAPAAGTPTHLAIWLEQSKQTTKIPSMPPPSASSSSNGVCSSITAPAPPPGNKCVTLFVCHGSVSRVFGFQKLHCICTTPTSALSGFPPLLVTVARIVIGPPFPGFQSVFQG